MMARQNPGTHHHSPLAGVGAGTAAVLFAFGVVALAWHRVAAQVSTGITVLVYVVITAVCGLAAAALFYAVLWLRHRVRHPGTLAARRPDGPGRAYSAPAVYEAPREQAEALGASRTPPAAIEPPQEIHLHFHTADPAEAAAIIRTAIPGPPGDAMPGREL